MEENTKYDVMDWVDGVEGGGSGEGTKRELVLKKRNQIYKQNLT